MIYGEKSRQEMNEYAEKLFAKSLKRKEKQQLYDNVKAKFGLSESIVEPMITFKKDIKEYTQFEVFAVLYFLQKDCLGRFFTEKEISALENEKIVEEKIGFPIEFPLVNEVSANQWITVTSARQLMRFRQAGFINYAEGEQRALKRVKFGNEEIWKPFVNNKAVEEIKAAMLANTYVPDTITINIPEGSDYIYNDHELVINSTPNGMVNLIDGYHRYLAIARICDFDDEFDYPMELRIVAFTQPEAEAFIFQQDQKTKMKRVVSDSYNPNSAANKIVNQINTDSRCYLMGKIGRNKATINAPYMSRLIEAFLLKNIGKENEIRESIRIKGELIGKINQLIEENQKYLDEITDIELAIMVYLISKNYSGNYDKAIRRIIGALSNEEKEMFKMTPTGKIRRGLVAALEKAVTYV